MGLALYRRNGRVETIWTGPSTISGVLSVNSVPSKREILLLDMDAKIVRRTTFSDESGNYSFTGLPAGQQWILLFIDVNGVYNAVARSHVTT